MLALLCSCIGQDRKDKKRVSNVSRFQKRRNSLRGNFVTKYVTPVEDDYVMDEKTLGKGSYGIVVKAYQKSNMRAFAIKFLSKVGQLTRIEREVKLLTDIDHANIVRLFSVYDSATQVAFVFDLCTGGDLTELVLKSPKKYLPEESAKVLIRQLVSAVAHIHSRGICHRDIKMQNILLETMDSSHPQIKLIDFGLATRYVGVTPMKTRCGTPYSTAPEVFRECYDERCDVWSVGIVSYYLLCGHRPFSSVELPGELKKAGKSSIVTSIMMGRYHFNHPSFRLVSPEGIAFIQKSLAPKYTNRWHAIDAVNCPWLSDKFVKTSQVDFSTLKSKDTPLSLAVSNLCGKRDASVLGNTGMVAVAFDHSRYDAPEIRTLFQFFDKENAGFLSKKAFRNAMKSVSPNLSMTEIDFLFEAIDVDNDKQISFTEFLAATMDPREVDTQELGKAFELLDSDNKGYLTVDDFYRVLAVNPDRSASLQLQATAKIVQDGEDTSGSGGNELSSSGIPYFDESEHNASDKTTLLKKIAQMIKVADVNNDGVLSYSEFLMGIVGMNHAHVESNPASDPDESKTLEQKARLDALLGNDESTTNILDGKSFLKRSFTPQHRKTAPLSNPSSPLTSPVISPVSSPAPALSLRKRFGLGLRAHKTVPGPPSRPNDGSFSSGFVSPQESCLEINGVSGFFDKSDCNFNSAAYMQLEHDSDVADKSVQSELQTEEQAQTEPDLKVEIRGPPSWLVGEMSVSEKQKGSVVRLPPIV